MRSVKFYLIIFYIISQHTMADSYFCNETGQDQSILSCSSSKMEMADFQLNVIYRETISRINNQYIQDKSLAEKYVSTLKKSQRAWVKLRDENCKLEAFEIEQGTEAYETTVNNCIATMSKDRTTYLRSIAPDI